MSEKPFILDFDNDQHAVLEPTFEKLMVTVKEYCTRGYEYYAWKTYTYTDFHRKHLKSDKREYKKVDKDELKWHEKETKQKKQPK